MTDLSTASMKTLEFGETPWDSMTREELLREVQRMYSAVSSARCTLNSSRGASSNDIYWGKPGSGGRTMIELDSILDPLQKQYGDGNIYRSFFRYANSLLFPEIGDHWEICPKCGTMLGDNGSSGAIESRVGKPCYAGDPGCDGVMRPLEWKDLAPLKKVEFRQEFLGISVGDDAEDDILRGLAHTYHAETEAYDRTVCTGPIVKGSIRPIDGHECGRISRHARAVRKQLEGRALALGLTGEQLWEAIRNYRSPA